MSGTFSLSDFLASERSLYARRARGVGRWDARLKLLLSAAAVLLNVLLPSSELSALLAGLAWAGLASARIPWRQALLFILAPAWATALVALGFGLGFGQTPLFHLGPLTIWREGAAQGFAAALRVAAEVSWMALLMLTTPFTAILQGLRRLGLPELLVDTLASMYRYIFLLFDEFQVMRAAAKARGGFDGYGRGLATLGTIAAQVFLRAVERAERIDLAMRARGRDAGAV